MVITLHTQQLSLVYYPQYYNIFITEQITSHSFYHHTVFRSLGVARGSSLNYYVSPQSLKSCQAGIA